MNNSLLILIAIMGGCAWEPRIIGPYPDGLRIAQVDQYTLDKICSRTNDHGLPSGKIHGCYSSAFDMIYLRADCRGAQSLIHELAHRQGIANPSNDGYDW